MIQLPPLRVKPLPHPRTVLVDRERDWEGRVLREPRHPLDRIKRKP